MLPAGISEERASILHMGIYIGSPPYCSRSCFVCFFFFFLKALHAKLQQEIIFSTVREKHGGGWQLIMNRIGFFPSTKWQMWVYGRAPQNEAALSVTTYFNALHSTLRCQYIYLRLSVDHEAEPGEVIS